MKDGVGVVVEEGEGVVSLPCDVVLPCEVECVVEILKVVVLATELPEEFARLATDADHGEHVSC